MRRLTLAATTILAVGIMGCDRLPFVGGGEEEPAAQEPAAAPTEAAQVEDTATQSEVAPEETPAVPETPPPAPTQTVTRASAMDEPWTPTHTGTVDPGMSRDQVIGVWGPPVTESALGNWTYLYFRNGCEVSCGTFDVVLLENDQVVDAVVRGPGHGYSGVSSSPPGRTAEFTPPIGG